MIETDADRLAEIQAVGEAFSTGSQDLLWGVFDRVFLAADAGAHVVESRETYIECRSSDVTAHQLVKGSQMRRVADDSVFFVKRLEPDGTGMTRVMLRQ